MNAKRLIEVDLPIRAISAHARRDQNIRKGHLHTMHVWWATRPLASCRAVTLATMLPDPADESCPEAFLEAAREEMTSLAHHFCATKQGQDELVIDLKKDLSNKKKREAARQEANRRNETWENLHKRERWTPEMVREALLEFIGWGAGWEQGVLPTFLDTARKLVGAAHPNGKPMVLDPFAGAGSIPFEALRVGADAFASDLNPVAVLLNKVALEYLPKYGKRLAEGVEKWGKWVLEEARKKLAPYYPADAKGNIPLAYIWARTITCEGPGCGAEVPLLGMLWLSHKTKNKVALRYSAEKKVKRVIVDIFRPKLESELQPRIVKRFAATCPVCGYTTPYKRVRQQLSSQMGGTRKARLLAVIMLGPDGSRSFRVPNDGDLRVAKEAAGELQRIETQHKGPVSAIPDEPTMQYHTFVNRARIYGIPYWGYFFTERQALALFMFASIVHDTRDHAFKEAKDPALATAVTTCLALALSNITHYNTGVSFYGLDHMISCYIQGCGFPMRPDFAEANPLMPRLVGGFEFALGNVCQFLQREAPILQHQGTATRASATRIPLPDQAVPYVVTDPPYYYTIQYADSSDLPYVWLKRAVGDLYPDLFATALTPKDEEIIVQSPSEPDGEGRKNARFYEREMLKALADCRRVLMPSGVAVVLFAHKQTAGWEALLSALVGAGWTVTASWPIETERGARLRAGYQAMLASTVFLVCRPVKEGVGDWRDVLAELPKRIQEWMPRLTTEGIVGADAIFACLGPALEIFSRYSRVEKASGEQVSLRDYLEQVWAAVAQEALRMLFEGADTSAFEEDARLTAMWLWTLKTAENGNGKDEDEEAVSSGGYVLEYDAARKIALGVGAHLDALATLVAVKGDEARLLPVDERSGFLFGKGDAPVTGGRKKKKRRQKSLFAELDEAEESEGGWGEGGAPRPGQTTLDRVHQAMLLFASGRSAALRRFLVEEGIGRDGRFWTLAQALSALYPSNTQEKRWVDGVLARKKGLGF